jgi:hypothetical protein
MKKIASAPKLTVTLTLLAGGIGTGFAAPSPNLPTGPGQCVPTLQTMPDGSTRTIYVGHPCPNPRPAMPQQIPQPDGVTTKIITGTSFLASKDPFADPVNAANLIPNFNGNLFDGNGVEMPNTLPSSPEHPYNLHDAPVVTDIDKTSPTDDLLNIFNQLKEEEGGAGHSSDRLIQLGLDILEGNPIANRNYSGIPVLHYKGPEKIGKVEPITDANGNVVGGNVNIHQVWFDSHIETDTALLDVSAVKDVPWTITYSVDVLTKGEDDFSPMVMYLDDPALSPPGMPPMPHTSMDTTFFPMKEGTRNVFVMKMPPGKYYNLSYNWGWREHPPRAQATEEANKKLPDPDNNNTPKTLVQWEQDVFGVVPSATVQNKLAAIAKIGELAPEKRMWMALRKAAGYASNTATKPTAKPSPKEISALMEEALAAFDDWSHRTRLPRGVQADPNADVTLFYVNNTIYGTRKDGGEMRLDFWRLRGQNLKITLLNGDHFLHSYVGVDFGGARGWENQFQSTKDIGGSGCWFTFGRFQWQMVAGGIFGLINVPPVAADGTLGLHKIDFTLNFEPSRRLRLYQFDPMHHETAIFSFH